MMATRSCAPLRPRRCGLNDELSKRSPLRKSNKTATDQEGAAAAFAEKWASFLLPSRSLESFAASF
jgi:hypothetical protein